MQTCSRPIYRSDQISETIEYDFCRITIDHWRAEAGETCNSASLRQQTQQKAKLIITIVFRATDV
jgi:hypothetical protein